MTTLPDWLSFEEYVGKLKDVMERNLGNEAETAAWAALIEARARDIQQELGR